MIYLDNNATTVLDPKVLEEMWPYLTGLAGNPSSRHALGRYARQAIDRARLRIAEALGAEPSEVYFTSGATESNNLAIANASIGPDSHVLVNPAEHPSALEPALALAERGRTVERFGLDTEGRIIDPHRLLRKDTSLIVCQWANSETGCLQDIRELSRGSPENCWLHCDATQAVGKVPVDFAASGATSLSFSGHKLHGPSGVGILIVRRGNRIRPMLLGGHQQEGVRPGTEPVAAIVGLGATVEIAIRDLSTNIQRLQALRDLLEEQILSRIQSVVRNGPEKERLPNTSNLSFHGTKAEALLIALDLGGLRCSAGTACASGSLEPSAVLTAMGISGDRLESALRFSVSRFTTKAQIQQAVSILGQAVNRLRKSRIFSH